MEYKEAIRRIFSGNDTGAAASDSNEVYTTPGGSEYEFFRHNAGLLYTSREILEQQAVVAEIAGRCSHRSDWDPDKSPWEFLSRIVKKGHLSVLRHINLTCRFETDRTASHQLVRHSHISWTQESQRYVLYGKRQRFAFVIPEADPEFTNRLMRRSFMTAIDTAVDMYNEMINAGIPAEEARKVLPGCTRTVLYGTGNVEAWGHFFKMRCDKHAQTDIRHMAERLFRDMSELMPGIYDNLDQY